MILSICQSLEATALASYVRESTFGFPVLVAVHLLGLGMSAGLVAWFDLRLMGLTLVHYPTDVMHRRLRPWIMSGFSAMVLSGAALFVADATAAYGNVHFRVKAAALLIAAVNALVYHVWTVRQSPGVMVPAARLAGVISLVAWVTVIVSGRMMSYTMF